jgi:hypothetical protein
VTSIPIKHRETEEYALKQPDMIRVSIATGQIIVDRRDEYFGLYAPPKGERKDG